MLLLLLRDAREEKERAQVNILHIQTHTKRKKKEGRGTFPEVAERNRHFFFCLTAVSFFLFFNGFQILGEEEEIFFLFCCLKANLIFEVHKFL